MITLEQARALLPPEYKINDPELLSVIADAYTLAEIVIDDYLAKNNHLTLKKQYHERQ